MKIILLLRYCLLVVFFLNYLLSCAQIDSLVVEGNYQNKNIYVQNPLIDSNEFCIQKIKLNEKIMENHLNSSAIEIRLDTFDLKVGDLVKIIFYHRSHCTPRILHENYHPVPTFEIQNISIDSTGLLKWNTKNEMGSLTYIIEHFVWNKWINIGEVGGTGKSTENNYSFNVRLHSGENKVRVKQNEGGKTRLSAPVIAQNKTEKPKLINHTVTKKIEFTNEVRFEIYDAYGHLKYKGIADVVDISDLPKGYYYLNYDSESTEFIKQ